MKYFARIDKKNIGPLSLKELVEAGIRPSTYIWHKGLPDWQKAEEDPDICRAIRRYLAGYDPETGLLPTEQPRQEASESPEQQLREAAEQGMLGLHGLPEPPDKSDVTVKPNGVSVISALLVTIFCFPVTGLIALFFAMRCNADWKMSLQQDLTAADKKMYQAKAHSDARVYRMMMGISICIAFIMFGIALFRVNAANAAAPSLLPAPLNETVYEETNAAKPSFTDMIVYTTPSAGVVNMLEEGASEDGIGQMMWLVDCKGKELKINRECRDKITLSYEGEVLFEIPATCEVSDANTCSVILPPNFFAMGEFEDFDSPLKDMRFVGIVFNDYKFVGGNPGEYVLDVPEDFFIYDGNLMQAHRIVYTIEQAWKGVPENGAVVQDEIMLNNFEISYLGNITSSNFSYNSRYNSYPDAKITVTFRGEDVTDNFDVTLHNEHVQFASKDGKQLHGAGELSVRIDHGYFLFNRGSASMPVDYSFSIPADSSAIESVNEAEENQITVYNLQGVNLLENAAMENLKNLPTGLYIVNGKKVYLNHK